MKYKEAKITLDYNCNNNCIFCYERENREIAPKTTLEVKKEIDNVFEKNYNSLHLIGGEPTIRKDILELIKYAKEIGLENVMITSNGRRFCYMDFTKAIFEAGLDQVILSIHGHNSEVHDKIIQVKGGFAQLIKGLNNLKEVGFNNIGTNTTICQDNYNYLEEIGRILLKYNINRAEFIYAIDMTSNNFNNISPKVSSFSTIINNTIKLGIKKNYKWNFLNPPLCCSFEDIIDNHINYGDSSDEKDFVKEEKHTKYFLVNSKKVIDYDRNEKCNICALKYKCKGINKKYKENYGQEEVKSILKK